MAMSDQSKQISHEDSGSELPRSRQTMKSVTVAVIGVGLELMSGLSFTGGVMLITIATPLMVILSPILVPAGIAVFLLASGLFFSGGSGVAAVTVLTWMYNYVTGKPPPGADQLDSAMEKIANKVNQMKKKTQVYGQHGQFAQIGL